MITIRPMTLLDQKELEPILEKEFDAFWTPSVLKEELTNSNSRYFVAKQEEQILGFAGIWIAVDDVHITNIVTKKQMRRKHIGSLLLEVLIKEAKASGKSSLTLEVNEHNLPAIALYEKYHFKVMGRRKKYYHHKEDAIIMTYLF